MPEGTEKDFKDVQCKLIDIDQLNKVSVCEFQLNEYLSAEDMEDMTASLNTGNNKDKLYNFLYAPLRKYGKCRKIFTGLSLNFSLQAWIVSRHFRKMCMQNSDPGYANYKIEAFIRWGGLYFKNCFQWFSSLRFWCSLSLPIVLFPGILKR